MLDELNRRVERIMEENCVEILARDELLQEERRESLLQLQHLGEELGKERREHREQIAEFKALVSGQTMRRSHHTVHIPIRKSIMELREEGHRLPEDSNLTKAQVSALYVRTKPPPPEALPEPSTEPKLARSPLVAYRVRAVGQGFLSSTVRRQLYRLAESRGSSAGIVG